MYSPLSFWYSNHSVVNPDCFTIINIWALSNPTYFGTKYFGLFNIKKIYMTTFSAPLYTLLWSVYKSCLHCGSAGRCNLKFLIDLAGAHTSPCFPDCRSQGWGYQSRRECVSRSRVLPPGAFCYLFAEFKAPCQRVLRLMPELWLGERVQCKIIRRKNSTHRWNVDCEIFAATHVTRRAPN